MKLNIAHSELPEQQGGLMICGYEWGVGDTTIDDTDAVEIDWDATCTFSNKQLRYGPAILAAPYDRKIKKWFEIWGAPLNEKEPGAFEKSIVQTNWCSTQNPNMEGDYTPLWQEDQVDNFIGHVAHFSPTVILFMGSQLIKALQNPTTLKRFEKITGKCTKPLEVLQKPFDGTRFKVSFQQFERCKVVCLPHPSASRGLSNDYIGSFNSEIGPIISEYKSQYSG